MTSGEMELDGKRLLYLSSLLVSFFSLRERRLKCWIEVLTWPEVGTTGLPKAATCTHGRVGAATIVSLRPK